MIPRIGTALFLAAALPLPCAAQDTPPTPAPPPQAAAPGGQINVNWLYGSYVPKDVPLEPLNGGQRATLYVRQTYTTVGIYVKTTFFAVHDQIHDVNEEWGSGWAGFGKRFGTRQAEFIVQNSVTSLGDAIAGWEPRYDRCRCDGVWKRTRHAVARNFVTYARDERSKRPQLMPYLGAFAGASLATTWEPGSPVWWKKGYQAAIAQTLIGAAINWIGEFAPEIFGAIGLKHDVRRDRSGTSRSRTPGSR
jgi:hypothetical protein